MRSLGAENDGVLNASGLGLVSVRETSHDDGFSASRRQASARVLGRIIQIQDLKYRFKDIFCYQERLDFRMVENRWNERKLVFLYHFILVYVKFW